LSPFVLDNSVTMCWCFEDTSTPYAEAILQELINGIEAIVPALWPYEVISVLGKSERNGSLTSEKALGFLEDFKSFSITVDEEGLGLVFASVHPLALSHRLSGYDASYLELAIRKGLPMATLDEDLQKAAAASGVKLVDV
jgi:predicted nucleic acid-binding protein